MISPNLRHHSLLLLSFLLSATATSSPPPPPSASSCDGTCGTHRLPYPFGFSSGCPIPLFCANQTTILLTAAAFPVQAVTSDRILISLKPSCSRSVDSLRRLFTPNFAPTRRNAFLLRNCSGAPFSNCTIPSTLVQARFELSDCGGGPRSNLSCYSDRKSKSPSDFFDPEAVFRSGCGSLFSSIWSDANCSPGSEANETSLEVGEAVVALEVEVVELRWWLQGRCDGVDSCSSDADCEKVPSPANGEGFRCRCRKGFEGDGYIHGHGCLKASACDSSKYLNGKCSGLTKATALVSGTAAGASLALVCLGSSLCLCFLRKRRMSKFRKISRQHISESSTISIPIYPYREIERATDSFSEEHRLGTGAYGTVYRARLDDLEVAIKCIKHRDTGESFEQVINEIKLLSSVNHPNLVHLLGCSIENMDEQILVYEYMPNGTLCEHLQRERGDGLAWPTRVSIAKETAQAIAYLHSTNPPIFHRDIKSSNILLDFDFKAKVADFGLSRLGLPESSHVSTAPQGTPGYLDPQYHQCFHLSDKSDVYSFGVVLAEIITGLKVVDFSRPSDEVNLAAFVADRIGKGCVDEIVDAFFKHELADPWTACSVQRVSELAFRCLAYHQDTRPSMSEVASELEQIGSSRQVSVDEADSSALLTGGLSRSSLSSDTEFGMVEEVRVGSLAFYILQTEDSCEISTLDVEDGYHVSTQE